MPQTLVFILGMILALSVAAAWLWRTVNRQTPDYDIETYLHGAWVSLGLISMGRSYRNHKRLTGSWDDLHAVIDLRVRRPSLLSLSEEYLILLSHTRLPDSNTITTCHDTCKQESFRSVLNGAWNVSVPKEGVAIGRALFRIPADRRVRTPIGNQNSLEEILCALKNELMAHYG